MKCSKIWLQMFWDLPALLPFPTLIWAPFSLSQISLSALLVFCFLPFFSGVLERHFFWFWEVTGPWLLQLLQTLLWTPCTHQLPTGLYKTSPPHLSTSCCSIGPLYFPGSTFWLFWDSLIFRFLRCPIASLCFFAQKCWLCVSLQADSGFHLLEFWDLWWYLVTWFSL